MAIIKSIKSGNGVTCSYHRILYMQITTNSHISIVVKSYIDGESRNAEKEDIESTQYGEVITYELPYDEKMGIKEAYKWLKNLEKYENSESDE